MAGEAGMLGEVVPSLVVYWVVRRNEPELVIALPLLMGVITVLETIQNPALATKYIVQVSFYFFINLSSYSL